MVSHRPVELAAVTGQVVFEEFGSRIRSGNGEQQPNIGGRSFHATSFDWCKMSWLSNQVIRHNGAQDAVEYSV
jgi:hypothetical protein